MVEQARLRKVCTIFFIMLCLPALEEGYKQANGHFVQYRIIILLDLQDNRSVRVKSSFKRTS